MKKIKIYLFVLMSGAILSCKNGDKFKEIKDTQQFATELCDCMKKNGGSKDYIYAATVCDGELVQRNRFYRLYKIDLHYIKSAEKLSYLTRDSVFKFMRVVDSLTRENCCKFMANCPGVTK